MKIDEIYNKYKIPKILQQHMYRVAAVSSVIIDYLDERIILDKDIIIKVALLHDMGNIIKMYFIDHSFIDKDEFKVLEKVKKEFVSKYGNEEHIVTLNILKEIGVSPKVLEILENIGSSKISSTTQSDDWNKKVCSYADFRIDPNGVVSVIERFNEIIKRYKGINHILADSEKTEQKKKEALILEAQIQERCSVDLCSIDDSLIEKQLIKLREYKII